MTRRFLCPSIPPPGQTVPLDASTSHHVLHVVCIARGEQIVIFDGQGFEARARLADVRGGRAIVETLTAAGASSARDGEDSFGGERGGVPPDHTPVEPSVPDVGPWLLLSLVKGDAFDRALRMATELGVSVIAPIRAERSIGRSEQADRWSRILVTAASQCGRSGIPRLLPLRSLSDALLDPDLPEDRLILVPGAASRPPRDVATAILLGPEGGWSNLEIETALNAGFQSVGLGPLVLRVDTAVCAALALYGGTCQKPALTSWV